MSSKWPVRTVGELVLLQRGIDLPEGQRSAGTVPVMGSFGITGWHNTVACKGPGVTVGRSGASAGVVSFIDRDFWPLNTCLYVRDFLGNDPRFVYYRLKTLDLGRLNSGSAQPSLNRNFVHPVPLSFPDPVEQKAIASLLGSLDDKIDLNRRMNETLEAMARAIFKDWFVDFGPTRSKMDGRKPYLAPDLWSLFPDRLDNQGKPEGWNEEPFTDFVDIISGGTPKTEIPDYWGGEIPWFSVVDTPIGSDVFVRTTEKAITPKGLDESAARVVAAGTTIISARGTVGNLAITAQDMTFNQSCYGLRAKEPVGDYFVYLAAERLVEQLKAMAHGSVFSTITRQTFDGVHFMRPSQELFLKFQNAVGSSFEKIKSNGDENRTLSDLRDLLLPKLMSGEIRVNDAEKIVGNAT